MFKRFKNWLKRRDKFCIVRTDLKGNVKQVDLTIEEAIAIEAIMTKKIGYFMAIEVEDKCIPLRNNIEIKTVLKALQNLAADKSDFKNELTNLVIDLNRKNDEQGSKRFAEQYSAD